MFRLGGNANRSWDLDESMWDAHGHLDPQGRLATDRPHVLKLYGATILPFGTEIGANFYAGSGTPLSTYVNTLNGIEVMVNGRGDMGRTPILSTTDLLVSHQIGLGGRKRLRLELNVLNLFNQKTVRHRFNYLNRARASSEIDLSGTNLAARLRLRRDDRRPDRSRRPARSAIRHGRPVQRRHERTSAREVAFLVVSVRPRVQDCRGRLRPPFFLGTAGWLR